MPGHEPLLIATGFSICGASAIGAMSGVVKARDDETATPIALVTLCGTLAIAVLPLLWHPLGLSALQFGHWVGAGVHDVDQVVAIAQIAGSTVLAVALVVKLPRCRKQQRRSADSATGIRPHRRGCDGWVNNRGRVCLNS
ncbi:YeiH family protein [Cryobacterium sp. TMT1-3]|uniref:YeiH family protein n=1 Tax=Cryobacterium sp. TMT1-3 TaxID=1259237 RepID=UPI003519DB42